MSKVRNLPEKTTPANNDLMYVIDAASGPNASKKIQFSNLRAASLPTSSETKALYEANPDTNAFTDAEETKLAGIETGATADQIASEVPYDNDESGLAATEVQAAIDELATAAAFKPSALSGLILHHSAGTARFDGVFFAKAAAEILLVANITNGTVYVDTDGIVKQTASNIASPAYTLPIARFTTDGTSITALQDIRVTNAQNIIRGLSADVTAVNSGDATIAGATGRVADAGHQHAVITAAPANQAADQVAAEGVSAALARADHVHNIATDVAVPVGTASAQGTSTALSKADHVHRGIHSLKANAGTARFGDQNLKQGAGTVVTDDGVGNFTFETNGGPNELYVTAGAALTVNFTAGKTRHEGTLFNVSSSSIAVPASQTSVVYVDVDGIVKSTTAASAPAGAVSLATVVAGVSTITSVTDRRVFLQASRIAAAPSTQIPEQANNAGTSNNYARADHIHNMPAAAPVSTSTANTKGVAATYALSDHTHNTVLSNQIVSETADTTTVSLTDTQLGGMTMTPAAGTWAFIFSSSIVNSANGSVRTWVNIYQGASVVAGTERNIGTAGGGDSPVHTQAILTVDGSTVVNVRWRAAGGTSTCHSRNFSAIRIG